MMRFFITEATDDGKVEVTSVHVDSKDVESKVTYTRREAMRLASSLHQCCLGITQKEMQRRGR